MCLQTFGHCNVTALNACSLFITSQECSHRICLSDICHVDDVPALTACSTHASLPMMRSAASNVCLLLNSQLLRVPACKLQVNGWVTCNAMMPNQIFLSRHSSPFDVCCQDIKGCLFRQNLILNVSQMQAAGRYQSAHGVIKTRQPGKQPVGCPLQNAELASAAAMVEGQTPWPATPAVCW